jgi:purine-binding chemotaxis protein CheW
MINSMQLCTFRLGDQHFGVDALKVQELIRHQTMTRVPLAPSSVRGLINLRGQIVTAIDLRSRFGLPKVESESELMNIVIRTDDECVSLLVDRIGDVMTVDQTDFEVPPETLDESLRPYINGAYKLEDRLLLLLDWLNVVKSI